MKVMCLKKKLNMALSEYQIWGCLLGSIARFDSNSAGTSFKVWILVENSPYKTCHKFRTNNEIGSELELDLTKNQAMW